MPDAPDISVVDLHRAPDAAAEVREVSGRGWVVGRGEASARPLEEGAEIQVGETVVLAPGARVQVGPLTFAGGNRGRAHALVPAEAFRASPGRQDVPRLIAQLEEIERDAESGPDPLTQSTGPRGAYERALSAEFARLNLDEARGRRLDEAEARRLGAVCLFESAETAFVAVETLTVPKLRALLEALGQPVHPHVVEPAVLEELFARVYRPGQGMA